MTVEVAWALAYAAHTEEADPSSSIYSATDLIFRGVHEFKGVWGRARVPAFRTRP